MISVRRASPNSFLTSSSSLTITRRSDLSLPRISSSSAMSLMIAFVLVGDLLALERRQPAQLQIENRLRLNLGKREALHRLLQLAADRS